MVSSSSFFACFCRFTAFLWSSLICFLISSTFFTTVSWNKILGLSECNGNRRNIKASKKSLATRCWPADSVKCFIAASRRPLGPHQAMDIFREEHFNLYCLSSSMTICSFRHGIALPIFFKSNGDVMEVELKNGLIFQSLVRLNGMEDNTVAVFTTLILPPRHRWFEESYLRNERYKKHSDWILAIACLWFYIFCIHLEG